MSVSQLIYAFEEGKNLAVVLKESYYGLIESGEFLVGFVASGIVSRAAVKHIASAIARRVLRYALTIREAEHTHPQRALAVVLGESSRTILRMCYIHVAVGCLVAVGTRCGRLFDMRILRQLGQSAQHVHHIRIREHVFAHLQQLTQIVHGWRNRLDEMLLALKVATESVCSEHLQSTEQHKQTQTGNEMAHAWHLGVQLQSFVIFQYEFAAQLVAVAC